MIFFPLSFQCLTLESQANVEDPSVKHWDDKKEKKHWDDKKEKKHWDDKKEKKHWDDKGGNKALK